MPVLAAETHAAGSALSYGFRVPRGAVRAGPMLPCEIAPEVDSLPCERQTAYLAIDGRPNDAVNAFLRQGYRMGYNGGARCGAAASIGLGFPPTVVYCRGELHQGTNLTPEPPTTRVPVTPTTKLDKSKVLPPTTLPRPRGRSVSFELRYGGEPRQPVALMTVLFGTQRPQYDCEYWPPCSQSVAAFRIAMPHFAALPRAGQPFEPALQSDVRVLPGSRVVMQVDGTGSVNSAFLTLMKVPEHLDSTVAAYRTAIARGRYSGGIHDDGERTLSGGWRVHSWLSPGYDGGPVVTLSVLRNGSTTYVAIQAVPYA